MGKRKVIIGLDQLCFLSGFEISGVDFNAFFYACMIQAGVEEFEVLNLDKADSNLNELDIAPPDSEFLSRRTSNLPVNEWVRIYASIRSAFDGCFTKDIHAESDFSILLSFLTDLMLSVKRKTSVVWLNPLPNLSALQDVMRPEFFLIVKNLFSAIEQETARVPIPIGFISSDHFRRFQDIISSDLFQRYSAGHSQFEDGRILKINAVKSVETSGRALIARNKTLLKAQRFAISTIPISTKVIDTVFGKLPGTL